jgi:trehalose 6-phosphate phosphatase
VSGVLDNLSLIKKILKKGRFGLLSDFDGTLSWLAPTPDQATISESCRRYLEVLSHHLPLVAVVSGRSLTNVRQIVNLDSITYIGNHGLERWIDGKIELTADAATFHRQLKTVTTALGSLLTEKGVFLEDKGLTATVHYRLSPQPRNIEKQLLERLKGFSQGLRLVSGKMSLNLLPPFEVNKGTAATELIKRFNLKGAVYLGDDITDIDAFKAISQLSKTSDFRGFTIAVIGQETPPQMAEQADLTVEGTAGVECFLKWLLRQVAPTR